MTVINPPTSNQTRAACVVLHAGAKQTQSLASSITPAHKMTTLNSSLTHFNLDGSFTEQLPHTTLSTHQLPYSLADSHH